MQENMVFHIERHLTELAKLRDQLQQKGAWSAAINAEVARGKAVVICDQKIIHDLEYR